jgi:ribosomal protein S18 acetylase RimI-like enzyme
VQPSAQRPSAAHEAGFTVRPARPGDLAGARALMRRTFEEDYGYGYLPAYHADTDDLQGCYVEHPRHALFVAVDAATGEVIGTAGIRAGTHRAPPHPQWLADAYDPHRTAQLVRVFVAREQRRRGIGRALVAAAQRFVAAEGTYATICLHTEARVPGVEEFWRAVGALVYDGRHETPPQAMYFEVPIPSQDRQDR